MEEVKLKKADLVLVWGSSWISKGIQLYELLDTGWEDLPSHVELVAEPSELQDISAEHDGVHLVDFARLLKTDIKVEIYRYKEITDLQREYVVNKALEWLGLPYDYGGLLFFLAKYLPFLRKYIQPEKFGYFCSELVDQAYEDEGIDFFPNKHPHEIHPGNLWLYCNKTNPTAFKKVFVYNDPKPEKAT